jgi:hypothetical protein
MMQSEWVQEILGTGEVKLAFNGSPRKPAVESALDDPLFRHQPNSGHADKLCGELVDDDFICTVSGLSEEEVKKLSFQANDHFQKRRTKEAKSRSAHEIHLAGIISRFRDDPKFEKIRFSDGWPRLLNSMTDFVLAEVGAV